MNEAASNLRVCQWNTLTPVTPLFIKLLYATDRNTVLFQIILFIKYNLHFQIYKFLEFTKEDSKILSLPERTVELYILSVASDWRHKGIAKSLSEESVRIAKEQGFEMMKVVCVNQFTIMAVQSLGFQEFYTLRYSDYSKRSGNDVTLREFPPHDCLSIYVKDLRT